MNHHTKTALVVPAFAVLFFSGVSAQPDDVEPGLHLKTGQTYAVTVTNESETSMNLPGMASRFNQLLSTGYDFSVVNVDRDGTATLRITIRDVRFSMDIEGLPRVSVPASYDSRKQQKPDSPTARIFHSLLGKSYTIRLAQDGRLVEVTGLKEILSNALSAAEADFDPQLLSFLNDRTIRKSLELMFDIYPGHTVRVGSSWTKVNSVTQGFGFDIASTFTLQSRNGGSYTLDVSGRITSRKDSAAPGSDGQYGAHLEGTQEGTLVVSGSSGMIQSGSVVKKISGSLDMPNPLSPGEHLQMPMNMTIRTRYSSER